MVLAHMINQKFVRRALIVLALVALCAGLAAFASGRRDLAGCLWAAGAVPVVLSLALSMVRDLLAGRMGVDAIALLSMAAALTLGEYLAGIVVAIMYAGGNVLEDFAIGRAERDLKALVDRAPRLAHRRIDQTVEDVPVDTVAIGDRLLVRAGEVVPVDGQIASSTASLDESAVTGEPIPVTRSAGEAVLSGTINAGETFEMRASAIAGDSTYAGIVGMVTAAQTAKSPFIRMADRYALLLLPVTLITAGTAWALSHDHIRALAVLVAATPCPLILAAPVAFIAGAAQAARRGILIKGGGPLEALARTHTVMFDKTGTLTIGGARLVAVETAPGQDPDEALRLAASLEQASYHVVAAAIVAAARERGLVLGVPESAREVMGTGLEGVVEGRRVRVGAQQFVYGEGRPEEWVARADRRASWRSALSVYVSLDGRPVGALLLADQLRGEAPRAVRALRIAGVSRIVMVTGDRADAAETIGAALDLDAVLADRVPSEKVDAVSIEQRLNTTVMVGDGINDAPALAAADVGIAMGARGASASSEAADVVILVDHLDRVSDAVGIARRTRTIALQSIFVGTSLSGVAMAAAAFGWLSPVAGALTQEVIDVAVILNALRALKPGHGVSQPAMSANVVSELHEDHQRLETSLDRLRQIADSLDDATPETAVESIAEANRIVATEIIAHERVDENSIYPRLSCVLSDRYGLYAMSRAHREILHLGKLLARLSDGLQPKGADRYLIRDAQRIIESIDSLVRIHNAQEEEIYESALSNGSENQAPMRTKKSGAGEGGEAVGRKRRWIAPAAAGLVAFMAIGGGWFYRSQSHLTAPRYLTQKVDRGPIGRAVIVNGVIGAADRKSVNALVTGVIQALDCDVGVKVTAGQLCAKVDPRPYKVAVDLAAANLIAARARAEKDRDKPDRERAKRGDALISKRQSELRAAEIALEHTNVLAPIDGTVIMRNVELGQRIAANEINPPLFIISENLAIARIEAKLDQRDFQGIKVGDPASIVPELTPLRSIAGVVSEIRQSPASGKNEAVYNLVVGAPNTDLLLTPAMKTTIRLVADRRDDVLRVTDGALRYAIAKTSGPSDADDRESHKDGSSRVWILRDARPTPISLSLGLDDGEYTEVVGGEIQLGDVLIIGETGDASTKTTEHRAPNNP
jgi:heavy metal translocating P-type ATPase